MREKEIEKRRDGKKDLIQRCKTIFFLFTHIFLCCFFSVLDPSHCRILFSFFLHAVGEGRAPAKDLLTHIPIVSFFTFRIS